MKAKHLTKNAISHKLVFLAAAIAIAIISVLLFVSLSYANVQEENNEKDMMNNCENEVTEVSGSFSNSEFIGCEGRVSQSFTMTSYHWPYPLYIKDYGTNNTSIRDYINDSALEGEYKATFVECWQNCVDGLGILCLHFKNNADIVPDEAGVSFYGIEESKNKNGWSISENDTGFNYISKDISNPNQLVLANNYVFKASSSGVNITGHVWDTETDMPAPGKFVRYCQWDPIWGYVPVFEEGTSAGTGFFGEYTLEGITEEMLPGKVFVYDNFELVGESFPIIFLPEGADEIKIPITINQEQPDPPGPVPPGPVPPGPNPPEPVPPVPPAPTPTPDSPGGGIAQTGDVAGYAFAVFAMMALFSAGVLAGRKLYGR